MTSDTSNPGVTGETEELIEAVARSIIGTAESVLVPDGKPFEIVDWRLWTDEARAAIAAVRAYDAERSAATQEAEQRGH